MLSLEHQNGKTQQQQSFTQLPVAFLCLIPLLLFRISLPFRLRGNVDFHGYWAAGRLFLAKLHPYSPTQMLLLERSVGWPSHQPLLMLCPPWTLPMLALGGGIPFHIARPLWLALSVTLNFLSAAGMWIYFGGSRSKLWVSFVIAATFIPMGAAEAVVQITPLMLASLTAFLLLMKKERYFLAGLCLFGVSIKPQLLYLVFLGIFLWIIRERRWAVLAGATVITSALLFAAALYNPSSMDYFHSTYSTAISTICGIGGILRSFFGRQHIWLQFLPTAIGIAWFLWYCLRRHGQWNWRRDLPLVTIISVTTAPYGWYHDLILVFPAMIALGTRGAYRSSIVLFFYLVTQMTMIFAGELSSTWMFTAGLLWIPFYLYTEKLLAKQHEAVPKESRSITA